MAFRKDTNVTSDFSSITISLASPETILERSYAKRGFGAKNGGK